MRRIRLVQLMTVRLGSDVGPQPLREAGKRMCHWSDTGCIRTLQLADEIEDPRQGLPIGGNFGLFELESRQVRDAFDLRSGKGHDEVAAGP